MYKTVDFAKQINLSLVNMWGIVQHFVDAVRARDNGCYVLLKVLNSLFFDSACFRSYELVQFCSLSQDPSKNVLRLYAVPSGSFDDDEDAIATPSKQAPLVAGAKQF